VSIFVRRVPLLACVVYIYDTQYRLAVCGFFVLLHLLLQLSISPFADRVDNQLETLSLFALATLVFTLFSCNLDTAPTSQQATMLFTLMSIVAFLLLVPVLINGWSEASHWAKPSRNQSKSNNKNDDGHDGDAEAPGRTSTMNLPLTESATLHSRTFTQPPTVEIPELSVSHAVTARQTSAEGLRGIERVYSHVEEIRSRDNSTTKDGEPQQP
jgi:hypothetical protein